MFTLIQGRKYKINGEIVTFVKTIDYGEITQFKKEDGQVVEISTEALFDVEIEKIKGEDK